jgi:mannose-6-phosphate isomerase-like protein (cupin superfamily)
MILSKNKNRPPSLHNPGGEVVQEITGLAVGDVTSHSLAEVQLPPGGFSTAHYHKAAEESYLILSGEALLVVEGQEIHLTPGDAVVIQPPEVHKISNPGEAKLVFLAVCVPAWQPEDSYPAEETGRK